MLRAILVSFLCVFLFSVFAVGGIYFVGELRYQELTKNQNNCSKSQSRINLILMCSRLIININSCCKQSPRQRIVKWSLHPQLASGGKSITFLIEINCLNVVQMIRIRQCERKRNLWNWKHEKALLVDLHRARRIYSQLQKHVFFATIRIRVIRILFPGVIGGAMSVFIGFVAKLWKRRV